MADFEVNFTLEQQPTIEADFSMTLINTDHDALTNRDMADQHPISAITGLEDALSGKQDILTAGNNIQIENGVISATDTTYTAGNGISIENNVISNTQTSAEWGNIIGTLSDQTDLQNALNAKQDIISDLTDIRNGAALGATALQPNDNISLLLNNVGYITNSALVGYATTTYVDNADNNLQSQIDAITAASDVTDIVGTYAELQAYNTTSLPNNSIIKVLQDESRNDETTYYRWVITGGVGTWVLIGEEGPYYTKSQADSTFVPQTRTVNGKALSTNITLTASDVGAVDSVNGYTGTVVLAPSDLGITEYTAQEVETLWGSL